MYASALADIGLRAWRGDGSAAVRYRVEEQRCENPRGRKYAEGGRATREIAPTQHAQRAFIGMTVKRRRRRSHAFA